MLTQTQTDENTRWLEKLEDAWRLGRALQLVAQQAIDRQNAFLAEKGLTIDQVRALSAAEINALNSEYRETFEPSA